MVSARVILRTGVSLTTLDPKHVHDSQRVARVIDALREMGLLLNQGTAPEPRS